MCQTNMLASKRRRTIPFRVLLFVMCVFAAFDAAAQLAAQRSSANGVIIAVTPGALAVDAKTWEFSLV